MHANVERCRKYALSLPEVTEEPHHHMGSFRVRGKIFTTLPPGDAHLHIFIDDERRQLAVAMNPEACEDLSWGKRVVGVRVRLAACEQDFVEELLESAWRRKAPKALLKALQPGT